MRATGHRAIGAAGFRQEGTMLALASLTAEG
jgi:hypothetical protein